MSKAEERALEAYDTNTPAPIRIAYRDGYEQAEEDILVRIRTRVSEIIGDAQPKPALRAELQELINKINNHE
jgi:hypothetical protein